MSKMNRKKVPYCLLRQNTESMKIEDYYLFKMNQNLRSLQFVPRLNKTKGLDPEIDGYIFCTMVNGEEDFSVDEYSREVWIFDASSLSTGPLCRLSHPDMNFSFTIHSAWIPDCVSQESPYTINIQRDYEHVINSFFKEDNKKFMRKFMKANVYPHFN